MNFIKNPNPTKDQHFMVDVDMLQQIYETANIQEGETIVEIGGGEGALTDYLAQGVNIVTVIEKDPYYANFLREKYKDKPNVIVVEGDALDYDFSGYDRIVANLPYTITEDFLVNLASTGALSYGPTKKESNVKSITLVLSQNSVRKMVAPIQLDEHGTKCFNHEFGRIGAITHAFLDVDIVTPIPSDAFFPEPAVTSFLVNLTPAKSKTTVDRILREMFVDKKGRGASIRDVYQALVYQKGLYKPDKHSSRVDLYDTSFTSKKIEDSYIYDLNNDQLSTLIQDLIKNDIKIKTQKQKRRNLQECFEEYLSYKYQDYDYDQQLDEDYFDDDYTDDISDEVEEDEYSGIVVYTAEDFANYDGDVDYSEPTYDDVEEQEEYENNNAPKTKKEKKLLSKYDKYYDATAYEFLLNRGLEYIDSELFSDNRINLLSRAKTKRK